MVERLNGIEKVRGSTPLISTTSDEFDARCALVFDLLPDEAAFEAALIRLPSWRRRKVESLRFAADRRRSVAVWLLLRRMLLERGFEADSLDVTENESGKPSFVDLEPLVHFSISHSGERVMAVVSDGPVGCDVERIEPYSEEVAAECLSPEELSFVRSRPSGSSRDAAFCRLWTRKESFLKMQGKDFSSFRSFSVLSSEVSCSLRDFDFGDGYFGCVCRENQKLPNSSARGD